MARVHLTRWLVFSALLGLLSACAAARSSASPRPAVPKLEPAPLPASQVAKVRSAPTRPAASLLWPVTSLRGADYIDVRNIARRYDLKATWSKSGQEMTVGDKSGARFVFEDRQRDFYFDGLRVFLGEAVLQEKDTLWISKLDVIKTVAPLFRPVDHVALLPDHMPRTIVLDPGHGGADPGKENHKYKINEKTLTLDVAMRLQKLLEIQGWRVVLTRIDDTRLANDQARDLQLRADFANEQKADLFISIHFNAVEKYAERVTGVETYVMSPKSMLSTSSEKKDEMTDVAFPGNRLDYANLLLGEQLHRAMIGTLKVPDRGYKRARFSVLRFITCPGALVECAYLSSDAEARLAATPEYRQKIAQALAAGLQNYATTLEVLHSRPAASANAAVAMAQAKDQL